MVFLVHPSSEPSSSKLQLLIPPLAAGCHCLVAVNGPSRVRGLAAVTAGAGASFKGTAADRTPSSYAGEGLDCAWHTLHMRRCLVNTCKADAPCQPQHIVANVCGGDAFWLTVCWRVSGAA